MSGDTFDAQGFALDATDATPLGTEQGERAIGEGDGRSVGELRGRREPLRNLKEVSGEGAGCVDANLGSQGRYDLQRKLRISNFSY